MNPVALNIGKGIDNKSKGLGIKQSGIATSENRYNQLGYFQQFQSGAGSNVFKANAEGVFAGGNNYSDAPFKLSYDGALISGSSASYQIELTGDTGQLNFYYNSDLTGKIVATSDGNMYQEAQAGDHYFATPTKQILRLVNTGDVELRTSGSYIGWTSGRKITDASSKLVCDGDFETTGSFIRDGDSGDSGSFEDNNGNTVEVKGGIITDLNA